MSALLLSLALICLAANVNAFTRTLPRAPAAQSRPETVPLRVLVSRLAMAEGDEEESATGRRKKRNAKKKGKEIRAPPPAPPIAKAPVPFASTPTQTASTFTPSAPAPPAPTPAPVRAYKIAEDGSSNLEDLFGLGSDQLRELNEQFLPLPREDLVTGKEVVTDDTDKVFKLPDLSEFMQETGGKNERQLLQERKAAGGAEVEAERVDRRDRDEYLRVLQLNPFADADESMFLDEVRGGSTCSTLLMSDCRYLADSVVPHRSIPTLTLFYPPH
jgi:hypothetical protein